ncbi:AGE family epimerase/isomerase [Nakamurella flavida]
MPSGGFGWLDERGGVDDGHPVQTWITARMTYVYSLAHLRGRPDAAALADHGVAALTGLLADGRFGGWYAADPGPDTTDTTGDGARDKRAYETAFVLLAASAATAAGRPGAAELLDQAIAVIEGHFWREDDGLAVEVWDRPWQELEAYRGANANMHLVEACLAAADVTGNDVWRHRALRIAESLIHGHARAHQWRLPEHYDPQWNVLLDYNRDEPAHPFRPYGATVGHWLEWARLLGHLHLGLQDPPAWLLADARSLFDASIADGWAVDGADGFVYTVDFAGVPVVGTRMHWVLAEGIGVAAVLGQITGDELYATWLDTFWRYAQDHLLDRELGSWHHELDEQNRPSSRTWQGKPDIYHAYQAVLLSEGPAATSLIAAATGR